MYIYIKYFFYIFSYSVHQVHWPLLNRGNVLVKMLQNGDRYRTVKQPTFLGYINTQMCLNRANVTLFSLYLSLSLCVCGAVLAVWWVGGGGSGWQAACERGPSAFQLLSHHQRVLERPGGESLCQVSSSICVLDCVGVRLFISDTAHVKAIVP